MTHQVKRYHDICAGHRVVGHESKCRHLHGHNYRVHFVVEAKDPLPQTDFAASSELDKVGRVIDFSVVKEKLCNWLEENWDHKFLHWEKDQLIQALLVEPANYDWQKTGEEEFERDNSDFKDSLVPLPFNPTAENLAQYLVEHIGPQQLEGTGVRLVEVTIEETAKCHVTYKWD